MYTHTRMEHAALANHSSRWEAGKGGYHHLNLKKNRDGGESWRCSSSTYFMLPPTIVSSFPKQSRYSQARLQHISFPNLSTTLKCAAMICGERCKQKPLLLLTPAGTFSIPSLLSGDVVTGKYFVSLKEMLSQLQQLQRFPENPGDMLNIATEVRPISDHPALPQQQNFVKLENRLSKSIKAVCSRLILQK